MSNDKPIAVATIKFYQNKHVEVNLTSIKGITPRTLDIASNIMSKTYRGMKAKFIAGEHKRAREEKAQKIKDDERDEAAFHEAEDKRLAEAAAMPSGDKVEVVVEKDKVESNEKEDKVEETKVSETKVSETPNERVADVPLGDPVPVQVVPDNASN